MLLFDFGAVLCGINYLSLRQAITPDRLLGRMTATMRFLAVAAAPLGSLVGGALATAIGLRETLLGRRRARACSSRRRDAAGRRCAGIGTCRRWRWTRTCRRIVHRLCDWFWWPCSWNG